MNWKKLGSAELKGLGRQTVYQLERENADIEPRAEVRKKDYDTISEERE